MVGVAGAKASEGRHILSAAGGHQLDTRHTSQLVRRALELAGRGDRVALTFLYVRYGDDVHEFLLAIVADEAVAAQLTRSVFTSFGEPYQAPALPVRSPRALLLERARRLVVGTRAG